MEIRKHRLNQAQSGERLYWMTSLRPGAARLLGLLLFALAPASAFADCYTRVGLQTKRYVVTGPTTERPRYGLVQADEIRGRIAYDCTILDGLKADWGPLPDNLTLGLELGGMVGSVIDSTGADEGKAIVGLDLGLLAWTDLALGISPHWVVGINPRDAAAWGVGLYLNLNLAALTGGIFDDATDALRVEP